MALIEVRNLKKYFNVPKGTLHAVDDISFTIEEGKTLGVVGESGCGKSTLGRTVLGLLPATDGAILYEGEDVTKAKGRQRKELQKSMQFIFQDPYSSLDPRMTVAELIAEPLEVHHVCKNKAEKQKRVAELMETVGLAERFEKSYPHELDGGRRQRIGIARALAMNPKFIICDEPVSALDVSIQAQILNLLQDLQESKNLAYIFITHDLSVVKHISDQILVMYLGCMVELSDAKELFEYPLHPYTKGLISAIPIPSIYAEKKRTIMQGELVSPINPKPGCRFAPRCPYATDECYKVIPAAEEIMLGHMVACHHVREINNLPEA